VVNPCGSIRKN